MNGCLSFSDKVTDGFYNIMGMDPFLWAMCNESEEGKRLPTLVSLRAVDPRESSMEVVLVDKAADPGLKVLEDKALEYFYASGISLELVKNLARLVSNFMGYAFHLSSLFTRSFFPHFLLDNISGYNFCMHRGDFETEHGDLYRHWKSYSKQMRKHQQCIVIPIGSLSFGLCRHRAILFKVRYAYHVVLTSSMLIYHIKCYLVALQMHRPVYVLVGGKKGVSNSKIPFGLLIKKNLQ